MERRAYLHLNIDWRVPIRAVRQEETGSVWGSILERERASTFLSNVRYIINPGTHTDKMQHGLENSKTRTDV